MRLFVIYGIIDLAKQEYCIKRKNIMRQTYTYLYLNVIISENITQVVNYVKYLHNSQ